VDKVTLPVIGGPSPRVRLAGPSPRVRLAQLTREAALAIRGVDDLDSGPAGAFCTAGAGHRIGGVTCTTAPEGGFDVSLRLRCELVPLQAVAKRVRTAVQTAAAGEDLAVRSVTIVVTDVAEPEHA
jgi:hypothetical protein